MRKRRKTSGTQIVFLDLGTPRAQSGKDQDVTEDDRGDDEEIIISDEDAEIMRDAYNLMKQDLIERGIPEDEIAFIQDQSSREAKAQIFEKMRQGEIRVLMGSTPTLGVGVNVQDRAAAIHHIDVPWRPRDLEQREGRIIRQGNQVYGPVIDQASGEVLHPGRGVKIFNYVQEGSFDEFMWQGVEKKGIAIKSLMRRHITQREMEDVDPLVMTAAELKGLSSGDKRVSRLVDLKHKIGRLNVERSAHDSVRNNARERVVMLESREAQQSDILPDLRKDALLAESLTEGEPLLGPDGQPQRDSEGPPDHEVHQAHPNYRGPGRLHGQVRSRGGFCPGFEGAPVHR